MSRVLFVDPIGGAAGDMLLAALLDAGAREEAVRSAVEAVVPGRFALSTVEVRRGGLRARLLRAESAAPSGGAAAGGPEHEAGHRFGELLAAIDGAQLPEGVRARARGVLERLGAAEGRVHGADAGDLTLHELGDDDTLLDVVGIAAAMSALDVTKVLVSALPLGAGGVVAGRPGHEPIPLPAAVTLELLRGFRVRGAPAEETVTPTAAAILAALGEPAESLPDMTLEAVGYGAGNRDPAGRPNVVRVLVGRALAQGAAPRTRPLTVLEANLDDLTPELVADATEALFTAGALDVWTTPVQMKKGRPGVVLSALCDPSDEPTLRTALFVATSTFGVRAHSVFRTELERRTVAVALDAGTVRVKLGLLGGRVVSATPEHDDVAALARQVGRPVRRLYEEAVAAAGRLRQEEGARP